VKTIILFCKFYVCIFCLTYNTFAVNTAGVIVNAQNTNTLNREIAPDCRFSEFKPVYISGYAKHFKIGGDNPVYSVDLIKSSVQGRVVTRILINPEGKVARICSVGCEKLKAIAEKALWTWQFKRWSKRPDLAPGRYIICTISFDFTVVKDNNGNVTRGRVQMME
jgi:hypothetical protein